MTDGNYWQSNDVPVQGQQYGIPEPQARKHSGLGIASFIISIVAGIVMFVLIVMAMVLSAQTGEELDEESPQTILLGCSVLTAGLLYLIGIGLAIGGLCQRNRYKVFAVLGLAINIISVLGIAGLMVIGLVASSSGI